MKFNKKTPLLFALCFMMLFALSTSAFAFDTPESECMPRPEPPKFRHCYPDPGEYLYLQLKCDEEGFNVLKDEDEDFGWQHEFPFYNMPMISIVSATLKVNAWDVDSPAEDDLISVDGFALGYLVGMNNAWSITEFDVPLEYLLDDGILHVWMDIDENVDNSYWNVKIACSELEVVYQCGHYRWRRVILCD